MEHSNSSMESEKSIAQVSEQLASSNLPKPNHDHHSKSPPKSGHAQPIDTVLYEEQK